MKDIKQNNLSQSHNGWRKGEEHWNWKGGVGFAHSGYLRKHTCNGRRYLHRVIWEEYHKACLLPWSNVHHINKIRHDNRIENLEAMMNHEHPLHHKKDMSDRICLVCQNNKTGCDGKQRLVWRKHPITKQKWLCHKCYCTIQNKRRWQEYKTQETSRSS